VILLWAGLVTLFLGPALVSGRYLSPADLLLHYPPWVGTQPADLGPAGNPTQLDSSLVIEPWLLYSAQRLHAGEIPLWNPDNMLGAPFLGNIQSALFYPVNWPSFAWPGGVTLVLRAWLQLLLAALGTYALAREVVRVGPLGAHLAALTYTFGAFLISWLFWPLTSVAIWLPRLWWATGRLVARPTAGRVAALAGLVALSWFAGHPETSYHITLFTGLFALFVAAQGGWRQPGRIAWGLGAWALGYALGAGVAAIQLLPFLEYAGQSMILVSRGAAERRPFANPLPYAWTLFSPDLYGNPAHNNVWDPRNVYAETNAYSGMVPLVLAPFAALLPRGPQRRLAGFLVAVGILALGAIYGWPLIYDAVTAFPLMRLAANRRLLGFLPLVLGLLAALGVEGLARQWGERRLWGWLAGVALAILLVGGIVPGFLAGLAFGVPAAPAPAAGVWSAGLLRALALLAITTVIIATAIRWGRTRPRWAGGALGALAVVLFVDLWAARADYNPTIAPADYYPPTPATRFLQAQPGLDRLIGLGNILLPNTNLVYGLRDVRGYDAIEPRLYRDLAVAIDPSIAPIMGGRVTPFTTVRSPLLNLLNVRYVLAPPGDTLTDPTVAAQGGHDAIVGEIRGTATPGQTFLATANNLTRIEVYGATFQGAARGPLRFHLKTDPAAPTDLFTTTLDAATLPDNQFWPVVFPPIPDSAGRAFYFYLDAPDTLPGQGATLWYNPADTYPSGSRTEAGQPAAGDLAFRALTLPVADDARFARVLDGGTADVSVFANQAALPRAWLAHAVAVEPDPAAQVARLTTPGFEPARTIVLAAPLPADQPLPPAPPPTATEAVSITRYAPETVEILSTSAGAGLLVLADQAFPGWVATLDGQPAPILTADHALRAVYVGAGQHTVRFTYEPLSLRLGAGLTGAALLALAGLLLWARRRPDNPAES
jgi:hypothetical protein